MWRWCGFGVLGYRGEGGAVNLSAEGVERDGGVLVMLRGERGGCGMALVTLE